MTVHGSYCWLDSQVHASSCICRCWLRKGEVCLLSSSSSLSLCEMHRCAVYIVL